jgi:VIT1/CCC1 family predicted Fe2+/Mn2+ transporter
VQTTTLPSTAGTVPPPHHEEWHTPQGRLIREVVFGANDGIVTLIGFVAGVTGALSSTRPIILASEALIIAGSVSMGIGAYLSSKAQREYFEHEIAREKWEIEHMPDMEIAEVREHYKGMGFSDSETEMITQRITGNPKLWLRFMIHEELGLAEESFDNPVISGLTVAGAYFVASWIPLLPYFFISKIPMALTWATILSISTMLVMGYVKAKMTATKWWKSCIEMAVLGTLAMAIGYIGSEVAGRLLPQ